MEKNRTALVARKYIVPFVLVTSLFFMWGFARSILDVLNKHFQESMDITITRSTMIQVTTYLGYFLTAIPAGLFINRFGYRTGVVLGLGLFGLGSLLFIPSERLMSFDFFLVSLFIIGCGLVVLEAAANPYVTELGERATAASRLNLAQSFNGLGCIIAPALVAPVIFGSAGSEGSVSLPYTVMGILVLCVAAVFCRVNLPEINTAEVSAKEATRQSGGRVILSLLCNRTFLMGLGALFFYEIAEISINSMFINYVTADGWMDVRTAALVLSFGGLGLFMLARVAGSWVMSRVAAEKVLCFCGVGAFAGALLVALNVGIVSKMGLFACYAFEAIMFPTIFALTVRGLGSYTKIGSSILMMSPIGGAVGTLLMGLVADASGVMSTAFVVPSAGYAFVLFYGITRLRRS